MFTTRKSKNLNPTDFVYLTDTCALLPEDPEAKGIPAVDPCIGIGSALEVCPFSFNELFV